MQEKRRLAASYYKSVLQSDSLPNMEAGFFWGGTKIKFIKFHG